MIEPRIYRAAFIPALFALVIAMFSLQSRPQAVPQALAADILFDGRTALGGATRLANAFPDRRPGTDGDLAAAGQVAATFRQQHFDVTVDRFRQDEKDLVNVVARRVGESTSQLVVVAPRDAASVPDLASSAADTASLLEIARTLEGRATNKTLVLASVDGSTLGAAGARRLAAQLGGAGPVEAVLTISNIGIAKASGSLLVPWSETTSRAGVRLQRTVGESLRLELQRGGAGKSPGPSAQWTRMAFPLGIGDQAPFIDNGFDALRISGSGELPPDHPGQPPSADRIGSLGRGALRTIFAYDADGQHGEAPSSYLLIAQDVLPRWSVALLALTLLLPLIAATIDGFARVRRRHDPVTPWLRWVAAGIVPFLVALVVADFLVLVGQAPNAPPVPLPPSTHPLDGSAWVTLAICTLFFVLTWVFARPRIANRLGKPNTPGAASALSIALVIGALLLWVVNPYALFVMLPALHLWILVIAFPVAPSRPLGIGLVLVGLLLPALVAVGILDRLSLDPFQGLWYGFLLVTGHHVGLYTTLLFALFATCFADALRIAVVGRSEQYRPR